MTLVLTNDGGPATCESPHDVVIDMATYSNQALKAEGTISLVKSWLCCVAKLPTVQVHLLFRRQLFHGVPFTWSC